MFNLTIIHFPTSFKRYLSEYVQNGSLFKITFDRHDIFHFPPMNVEFTILIMITYQFKPSFDFYCSFLYLLVNLGLLIVGLVLFVSLRYHVKPISAKQSLIFLVKSSGFGFLTSVGIFEIFPSSYLDSPNYAMQCSCPMC